MNYNDIIARIQKGESADAIAKEFTDNLNKAQAEIKKQEEAKKTADAKSKKLDEISIAVAHALNEYIKVAGIEGAEQVRGSDVREILDEFLPLFKSLKNVEVKVSNIDTPKALKSADKILSNWLKELGW